MNTNIPCKYQKLNEEEKLPVFTILTEDFVCEPRELFTIDVSPLVKKIADINLSQPLLQSFTKLTC